MFCGKCGTQVEDDALFCPSCGAKMVQQTPSDDYGRTEYAGSNRYNNNYQSAQGYQNQGYQNQNYQNPNQVYDEFGGPGYNPNEMNQNGKKNTGLVIGLLIGGIILAILAIFGIIFFMKNKAPETTTYYVTGIPGDTLDIEDEDGDVLKTVEPYDTVEVVKDDEDNDDDSWKVYLEDDEEYGYVDPHFLTEEEENATYKYYLYVENEDATLYKDQDEKKKICTLKKGETVQVIAEYDNQRYIFAEESSEYGYVDFDDLTDVHLKIGSGEAPTEKTTTYYVNFDRNQQLPICDDSGNAIGGLDFADEVQVISTDSDYWYVYSDGIYGFVDPSYLSKQKPQLKTYETYYVNYQKVTANGSYLALRSKSDLNNTIAKLYSEEVQVQLDSNGDIIKTSSASVHGYEGTVDYWYIYVPSIGKYGYVNSLYLKR